MYGNIEKLQEEVLKELDLVDIVSELIKKLMRHKKRSIARRNLGKIYRKKLSVFDSWMKHKCRVYNIRLREY